MKRYCNEDKSLIENYELAKADNFKGWCIHHKLEHPSDDIWVSIQELIDKNLYYNRPASELIFMRLSDHTALHNNEYTKELKAGESSLLKNGKPLMIDGIVYRSSYEAAALGVSQGTIRNWAKHSVKTNHNCKYIKEN